MTAEQVHAVPGVDACLGQDGVLSGLLENFAPRAAQIEMAGVVARAIETRGHAVIEAGTGTGKTLAYLLPALSSGKRVVLSTGTRNLQNQLFERDLPLACAALGLNPRRALLKGRANYLCPYRLDLNEQSAELGSREQVQELERIRAWSMRTRTGDIGEVHGVDDDSPVWALVTSTADNCLGQECPCIDDCPLYRARRQARGADVLVVNHHLLLADAVVRDEDAGGVVPEAEVYVLDEAHQLAEIAGRFFGTSFSSRQLGAFLRDLALEVQAAASDDRSLRELVPALELSMADFRLALGVDTRREAWAALGEDAGIRRVSDALLDGLSGLREGLQLHAERSSGLANCLQRAETFEVQFRQFLASQDEQGVQWFETHPRSFSLHITPASVASQFSELMEKRGGSWIFTSATLAVAQDFGHFCAEIGLDVQACAQAKLDSPFDYRNQGLLYVPRGLPDVTDREYTARLVRAVMPVLEAAGGRTFFLFTSYRAMDEAWTLLSEATSFPLFRQGDGGKQVLLDRYLAAPDGVLLATASFWEGVDVRGDALSCVIIDRLPFASPGDPVLRARTQRMREQGKDPFRAYQLPQAVISLKQGAGRLIRDVSDRGVLVIGDPRLTGRPYGALFAENLPAMPRTRDLRKVQAFFAEAIA